MLRSKITLYLIIGLVVIIAGQFMYFKHTTSNLKSENYKLKEQEKRELKRVRDSAFNRIETLVETSTRRYDSILSIPPTIKWKKYEKPVYIDRTLNDALDIHSDYKTDKRTRGTN